MKARIRYRHQKEKQIIQQRLLNAQYTPDTGRPMLSQSPIHYEVSDRVHAIPHGGIGAVHRLAVQSGLIQRIDAQLHLLKEHRPYHESDHVMNIAYNLMTGGRTLDDIDRLRQDRVHLDALGAASIPAPTTAGDFCRRFGEEDLYSLMEAINETRVEVWKRQPASFFEQTAYIDLDGSIIETKGECKKGVGYCHHKKLWGYNLLLATFANTMEPLYLHNRSGNRPDHEGAFAVIDRSVELCSRAGFEDIMLRGDTKFSLTAGFDRWSASGLRFVFGYDAHKNLVEKAEFGDLEYYEFIREADNIMTWHRRARQPRYKDQIVKESGYKNLRLDYEEIAEFEYRPGQCKRDYKVVVLRKTIEVSRGEMLLVPEIRYFFYITNDMDLAMEDVVFEANQRCDQENVIRRLKDGCKALRAPVNTLEANWAYMVMGSLAWTLKAWMALWLPESPRWSEQHAEEKERWLRMGFRTFLNEVIMVPAQIVRTGRQLIYRLLAWRPSQNVFFRLLDAL